MLINKILFGTSYNCNKFILNNIKMKLFCYWTIIFGVIYIKCFTILYLYAYIITDAVTFRWHQAKNKLRNLRKKNYGYNNDTLSISLYVTYYFHFI